MRRTLEKRDTQWNWPRRDAAKSVSQDTAIEAENWPKPRDLFFETGVVLGAALGLCAGVDVLLTILGVPQPY